MSPLAKRTVRPYAIYAIGADHYAVHRRTNDELVGDVLRVRVGTDRGMWRGVAYDAARKRFVAQSAAVFCFRWEAVGFLDRFQNSRSAEAQQ